MALAIKDPDAQVNYVFDWGADYCDGQIIAASSWQIEPTASGGLVVASESHDLLRAAARVAGGRVGAVYQLTNRITLSDGQTDDRSIAIRVDAR